jgi:N-carbamoyl-L-amino-acid hydrolase
MTPQGAEHVAVRSFDALWEELAAVGRDARTGGYERYAWTREDHTLREWFAGACDSRGLTVDEDAAGNLWAWWGDPEAVRPDGASGGVVTGSHLDSVPQGGGFDGPLGVVSALAAVDALRERGLTPAVPLGVACFGDEEGARFGIACAGSRILTGALAPERALTLADADGTTMAEALTRAGRDPAALGPDPRALRRVQTFVELHVEQGRALADPARYDQQAAAVAVGSDIWPHGRWRVDLAGAANHAGTTRLGDRDDAMVSYAQVVLAARRLAEHHGGVATMGKVRVEPNGVNAIPSHVTGWLDARSADEDAVRRIVADLSDEAARHGGQVTEESWTGTTRFADDLVDRLASALGPATPVLGTGAGHDAGILAAHGIPAAMLFVRNPTGVSHAPSEHAEPADCHAGVAALATVLADLTDARA